jgi:methionine aminopeptidase
MDNARKLKEIRKAVADYMESEGCSCCRDLDKHNEAEERLGKLLRVKKYDDGSGYNFVPYRSSESDGEANE